MIINDYNFYDHYKPKTTFLIYLIEIIFKVLMMAIIMNILIGILDGYYIEIYKPLT